MVNCCNYNLWILVCVCLGSMGMGLPFFSYGALLPYLSSLFYHYTGKLTSQAAMSLQPVILLMGITLTGSFSGILEKYVDVRILNFVLTVLYVTVVAISYYIDTFVILTVTMVIIGTLAGQINVCNVARLSEWNPNKSGTANGIMGFFMGISGFLGSFLCTVVINPYNKQPLPVTVGNDTAVLFVDSTVLDHTQLIWLAWAVVIAALHFPGLLILRQPTKEEEQELFNEAIDSYEAVREEKAPLILNRGNDYGVRSPDYGIGGPDEGYADDVKEVKNKRDQTLERGVDETSDFGSIEEVNREGSNHGNKEGSKEEIIIKDPDYSILDTLCQPKFYVLYLVIMTLSLTLLTSTELYKIIAIEAIKDDRFLNMVGALGSVFNAFGRLTWGMILDRIGTRYTFTFSFLVMGPLTVSLHYTKWNKYGYLINLCVVTFCTGIFTCIAPACQELFGRRDISLKYAATLSAEGFGCVLFFLLQLGQDYFYGELVFLIMMGIPSLLASFLAYTTFSLGSRFTLHVM